MQEILDPPITLDNLVDKLVSDGLIADGAKAQKRIVLEFPAWRVLSELSPEQLRDELSAYTGVPAIPLPIGLIGIDRKLSRKFGPQRLLEMRWLPLRDGTVAIANPFRAPPDGVLAGRPLCLAPYEDIDAALEAAFKNVGVKMRQRRRLGRYLLDSGAVDEDGLHEALIEQRRSGGLLGEILVAHRIVEPSALVASLAGRAGLKAMTADSKSVPLLPRQMAHDLRAVAIEPAKGPSGTASPVQVAFSDPTQEKIDAVRDILARKIEPVVTDDETLDALIAAVYSQDDVQDVIAKLAKDSPSLSAFRTGLSRDQGIIVLVLAVVLLVGLIVNIHETAVWFVGGVTSFYVLYTLYRLYSAWRGWTMGSTINPTPEDLASLDLRELPGYTVLLPVFGEKVVTLRTLFAALSNLDYPRQKLNGLLLVESDDTSTQEALAELERIDRSVRPTWVKTLLIPPGGPRTKPKAMIYAMLYTSGSLLTIFDAEDKPDPDQLKKAAWAFQQSEANVACIQAKLSYYNSRQNLLTRWFTLEYAAWFEMFLPGLHAMNAPIPLGGTSNHFRLDVLKSVLSWDPYNVTEDADLGLRFTRSGYVTRMLESTTYEEANSNFKNWLRQRSRWIKGYMQTFLVHTRHPAQLYRELGAVNSLHFMATVGGLIFTVVVSPLFWLMLVVWLVAQPAWIPSLFPGPVYYMAMASLVFGNFFFVFLALIGAVGRGDDDLSPYTLIFPIYWMMMSWAAYIALYELVVKPHYWQKTEHGLHLPDEEQAPAEIITLPMRERPADEGQRAA